jgi:hypothetical protein
MFTNFSKEAIPGTNPTAILEELRHFLDVSKDPVADFFAFFARNDGSSGTRDTMLFAVRVVLYHASNLVSILH